MTEIKSKKWRMQIYSAHIGLIDGDGNSMVNIIGKRGDVKTWQTAEFVLAAVNKALESAPPIEPKPERPPLFADGCGICGSDFKSILCEDRIFRCAQCWVIAMETI